MKKIFLCLAIVALAAIYAINVPAAQKSAGEKAPSATINEVKDGVKANDVNNTDSKDDRDKRTLEQFRQEPQNMQVALVAYWVAVRSSDKVRDAIKRGDFSEALLSVHDCMNQEENAGKNAQEAAISCMAGQQEKFNWLRVK